MFSVDADTEKARSLLLDVAKQFSKTSDPIECPVTAVGNGFVTLTLRVWCEEYQAAQQLKYSLLESARTRLKADGLELK